MPAILNEILNKASCIPSAILLVVTLFFKVVWVFFLIFDLLLLFFIVCPVIPQVYSEHILCAGMSVHSCLFLLCPRELHALPGCCIPQTHLLWCLFLSLSVLCMFFPGSFLFLWLVSYSISPTLDPCSHCWRLPTPSSHNELS